jgi:flagellar protein FliO/FliZ
MLESLFGAEVPQALKFVLAFVFVLALIGVTFWMVRRFGADRFGGSSARGRQPRLAVVDAAEVDARRKLVIIRRDNVEHLLMIGGPTDVVVEQNIVRAAGASREKNEPAPGRGLSVSETLTRPVPLGEGTLFPLQPETNGRPPRAVPEESAQWTWPQQGEPQRAGRVEPRLEKPEAPTSPAEDFSARPTPSREPTFARPMTPPARPAPPAPVAAPVDRVEKTEKAAAVAEPDQNLAEMATRLEASLRRPVEPRVPPEPSQAVKTEPTVPPPTPRVTPESRIAPPEQKPTRAEPSPKAPFESLEEEMANLLGRPPGKT